jgi:hypothetical protein
MHEGVQYPSAWLAAKDARIKANANKTRRRKLEAAVANDPEEFRCWLFDRTPPELDALRAASQAEWEKSYDEHAPAYVAYEKACKAWRKRVGDLPAFLREAMDNWGGLTDGQLAFARKAYARNVERADGRDAEENARRARAPHWTAGRETIEGVVQTAREHETQVAWNASAFAIKGLLLLDDGRKIWTSIPKHLWPDADGETPTYKRLRGMRLTFAVTVQPSEDDPSMAFGSRPGEPKAPKVKKERTPKAPRSPQEPRAGTNGKSDEEKRAAKRDRAARRRAARRAAEGGAEG